jgi:hypothetical protein
MSFLLRSYTDSIIEKIKTEGILNGEYHSQKEVERDVINIIWRAYLEYEESIKE